MDDSGSNLSSCSTLEEMNEGNSEKPVNNIAMGLVQQSSNIDNVTTSTSLSDMNVDSMASNSTFQDISGSSNHGASSLAGNQSLDSSFEGDQSGDMNVFHTKRKIHGKDKKVCRVCGDKALGYNFNAMTCESCKAFFRRNALKQQTPNCMFQGNCVVDVRTRRFCPHCRLKKCFNMGMKKEMILDVARLRTRKRPGSRKRKTDSSASQPNTLEKDSTDECSVVTTGMVSLNDNPVIVADCDNFFCWADSGELGDYGSLAGSWSPLQKFPVKNACQRHLSQKEEICLQELRTKYVTAIETKIPGFSNHLDEVKDFLNTSMIWAKKLITYVKSVDDFKQLSKEAQVMSIKSCVRSALTLIGGYRLDPTKNSFYIQGVYVGVDMFMRAFSLHREVAETFIKTCYSLTEPWMKDETIHALFHLILLFNPEGPDLLQRGLMSDLQNKYLILLKHYLEHKCSYGESKEYFATILQRSRDLKKIAIDFTEVLVHTDPQQMDPLAKEMYNFDAIM